MTPQISRAIARAKKAFVKTAGAALLTFWLGASPAPASRPRVTRYNGVYYGKGYTLFLKAAEPLAAQWEGLPTDKPVAVFLEFICPKPKTTIRWTPRSDVDNYAKGPLDVMTKVGTFWKDDDQVVLLTAAKRFAEEGEEEGVHIHWYEIEE